MNKPWWLITCFVIACSATRDYFDRSAFTPESEIDYVDPNSLYYDKHTKKELTPTIASGLYIDGDNSDNVQCQSCGQDLRRCRMSLRSRPMNTDVAEEALSKRIVNMLLSRATFTNKGDMFTGLVELEATDIELDALRNFGRGMLTLRQADTILSKSLKAPQRNRVIETWMWMESMTSSMYSFFNYSMRYFNDYKHITVGAIITLWLVWRLRKMRFKFGHIFGFGFVIIFVASFFITWWKLIQEAEIKHSTLQMKHIEMPIHCQPFKMSWWDKLTTLFASQDECEKYHEAVMKTPFLQVTPAQALSHMLSYVMHEPIAVGGKTFGVFIQNLTEGMPWLARYFIQVLICVTLLPLLVCCIILMVGGSLKIGAVGGLFTSFSLKGSNQSETNRNNTVTDNTARNRIEIILKAYPPPPLPATPAIEAAQSNKPSEPVPNDKPKKADNVKKRKVKREILSSTAVNETNAGASGDFEIIHKPVDSDTDSSEIVLKNVVPEFEHAGSGDSAS